MQTVDVQVSLHRSVVSFSIYSCKRGKSVSTEGGIIFSAVAIKPFLTGGIHCRCIFVMKMWLFINEAL